MTFGITSRLATTSSTVSRTKLYRLGMNSDPGPLVAGRKRVWADRMRSRRLLGLAVSGLQLFCWGFEALSWRFPTASKAQRTKTLLTWSGEPALMVKSIVGLSWGNEITKILRALFILSSRYFGFYHLLLPSNTCLNDFCPIRANRVLEARKHSSQQSRRFRCSAPPT